MSTQIVVTLGEDTYRRADRLARLSGRPIPDLLAEAITLSLSPLGAEPEAFLPVSALSDAEILTLTKLELEPVQDRRLSRLLHRQQAGRLTAAERSELFALMQLYQEGLLRKAQALHEAVRRGLMEPLQP
jgi:hypothetical protein